MECIANPIVPGQVFLLGIRFSPNIIISIYYHLWVKRRFVWFSPLPLYFQVSCMQWYFVHHAKTIKLTGLTRNQEIVIPKFGMFPKIIWRYLQLSHHRTLQPWTESKTLTFLILTQVNDWRLKIAGLVDFPSLVIRIGLFSGCNKYHIHEIK